MGDISILAFHESHMMDGMDAMDKRKKLGSRVRQLRYEHQINRELTPLASPPAGSAALRYDLTNSRPCAVIV